LSYATRAVRGQKHFKQQTHNTCTERDIYCTKCHAKVC